MLVLDLMSPIRRFGDSGNIFDSWDGRNICIDRYQNVSFRYAAGKPSKGSVTHAGSERISVIIPGPSEWNSIVSRLSTPYASIDV